MPEDHYFWYEPLERWGFDDLESMLSRFLTDLTRSLTHETQIRQRKGLLLWHYTLAYWGGVRWHEIYTASAFRWGGFRILSTEGRVYHAHPLGTTA
jgi:hypothetical protein